MTQWKFLFPQFISMVDCSMMLHCNDTLPESQDVYDKANIVVFRFAK